MKITHKHLRIILIALAAGLLSLAAAKALFNFELPERIARNTSTAVIVIAAGIFIYSRTLAKTQKKEAEQKDRTDK